MGEYIKRLSEEPTFKKEGFNGFCYKLETSEVSITLEDSYKKHDTYCTNIKKTSIYCVVDGEGTFIIDNDKYAVKKGDIIEIPKNIYIYLYRKQYETLSYATQSENKLPNIQKAYIMNMSSIK